MKKLLLITMTAILLFSCTKKETCKVEKINGITTYANNGVPANPKLGVNPPTLSAEHNSTRVAPNFLAAKAPSILSMQNSIVILL